MSVIFIYFVFCCSMLCFNFFFNFYLKAIFDIRVHIIIPLKTLKVLAVVIMHSLLRIHSRIFFLEVQRIGMILIVNYSLSFILLIVINSY